MLNSAVIRFYSLLVLLYFSDMVLLLSNIWNSLKVTSSPLFLGVTLSVGTALPFLLRKLNINKVKKFITVSDLYKRRIIVYLILLVTALLHYSDSKFGFIITSLSIGYLSLITLSTLESSNAKLVLDGHISSQRASRVMQTLVQIGSFFGALSSGYFLTKLDYNQLIMLLCAFDILVSLFGNRLYKEKAAADDNHSDHQVADDEGVLSNKLKYLSIAIGLIGLHICAFNTLTPILFQNVKNLTADYYGVCSGVAGVGAFLAAFVNLNKFRLLLPSITLTLSDAIFTLSSIPLVSVVVCFLIGFSLNTIRINLRKDMIDETTNFHEANAVAKFSATIYTFSQSIGPLTFGILTSSLFFGVDSSAYLFPFVGASMFIFILSSQQGKKVKCQKTQL
ncbi:hypothetical protein ACQE32_06890 [Pantoea sp. FN0302]|uniref:hypothetical protein n=1 Tax=Pantoea sp. FN0302 TaxID=3418558 RepID=UPI003CF62CFA